ncbi:MAG: MATE family efflux transporter [Sarcina sp.]
MFNMNVDMLKGKILKTLIIFAIPILISSLFQQLYNTIDIMIVGHYLGEVSLAAIGSSGAIYELLVGFALGVGNGLSIVVSRAYGAENKKLVKKSVGASLVIGIGLTIVMMLIGHFFLFDLLEVVNTPTDIIQEAYSYIYIISMSVGVMFLYNLAAGLLRSIGNSIMPLIFLIISSVINIILDIVFITNFNMGIKGAAYATVVAQGISGILCIIYILTIIVRFYLNNFTVICVVTYATFKSLKIFDNERPRLTALTISFIFSLSKVFFTFLKPIVKLFRRFECSLQYI